ncbi:asparagine synthase B [Leucobacter tardus]|uniref:asparagine synthase (glutamine-hydrolyzing) n=1 Tax=Leucobacter tardus TaxID=501483 RepID=A0A939QFN5_9MICO|nr:asparagine synthase-related protein [Leucobacter tardus]MBO2990967.1 asparagine synthetase B [Leucobacter tardus]
MSAIAAAYGAFDADTGWRMLERMRHRGPDGLDGRALAHAWIGTARLATSDIADPETSAMLGGDASGTWLVGDGEIIHGRRSRPEAAPDRRTTAPDLDAALRLFTESGPQSFPRLWGSFALVIAGDGGTFAAARDVFGIAPLYWAQRDGTVLFASEMKAFDADWRRDVRPFPPGHSWTPEAGLVAFPDPPGRSPVLMQSRAPAETPPEWVLGAVRETLTRAVERRLDAEAPVGILLSGGVDSSIVAAIASRIAAERGVRLPTFSVGMEGCRDLESARAVAQHLRTVHREHVYTANDAIALVPQIIADLEGFDPTLVHSAVPHFLVAELASHHVGVVLAGEGADELFAGYAHFGRHSDAEGLHAELLATLRDMHAGGLQRVDRMAAAHGLEARLPYLDLDVVELAMSLPPAWKLMNARRPAKWLLRRAFAGWLPDDVLWRRKEQFGQGTGMSDVLRTHYGSRVGPQDLAQHAAQVDPPLRTGEELAYYRMFVEALTGIDADRTVVRFAEA